MFSDFEKSSKSCQRREIFVMFAVGMQMFWFGGLSDHKEFLTFLQRRSVGCENNKQETVEIESLCLI